MAAVATVLGLIVLMIAAAVYAEFVHMAGFPDGHLTELERAQEVLFGVFCGICAVRAGYVWYLGWSAGPGTGRKLRRTTAAYLILSVLVASVDWALRQNLSHGGGG